MAQILSFTMKQSAFDSDATAVLAAAYDKAIAGFANGDDPPKAVQEVIAKRIIVLAAKGERDPSRLCEAALRGLRSTR
jgi:hypothetical protein